MLLERKEKAIKGPDFSKYVNLLTLAGYEPADLRPLVETTLNQQASDIAEEHGGLDQLLESAKEEAAETTKAGLEAQLRLLIGEKWYTFDAIFKWLQENI